MESYHNEIEVNFQSNVEDLREGEDTIVISEKCGVRGWDLMWLQTLD